MRVHECGRLHRQVTAPCRRSTESEGLNLAGGLCNRIGLHPQTQALSTDEDIRAPAAPVS